MSPQSIVCTTCDAAVPYGRLSCPACGELLASVAGAARPTKTRGATTRAARGRATPRAVSAVLADAPPQKPADVPSEPAAWAPHVADPTQDATSTSALGWDVAAWDMHEPDDHLLDDEVIEAPMEAQGASPSPFDASGWEPSVLQRISDTAEDDAPVAAQAPAEVAPVPSNGATDGASRGFSTVAWPADQPPPVAWPADQAPPVPLPAAARPSAPSPFVPEAPGAYVPPVVHTEPAGAAAPARAWAGQAAAVPEAEKDGASRTSMAGDLLDAARVTEFVGWLAVAGSAMAAVGFLLPWGVSVIGASGIGYFDRWGLAGPYHLLVFASLLGLLALSLLPNRVPLWLRVGVLGLGLGALLLGLTWPYLVGLTGTGPGAMVVAVGALILGAAGVVTLASDRHANEDQPV
jgi:hypothetical protein